MTIFSIIFHKIHPAFVTGCYILHISQITNTSYARITIAVFQGKMYYIYIYIILGFQAGVGGV